jgi:uncharacterized membrane protein
MIGKIVRKKEKDWDLFMIKSGIFLFILGIFLSLMWLTTPYGLEPSPFRQMVPVVNYVAGALVGLIAILLGVYRKIKKSAKFRMI